MDATLRQLRLAWSRHVPLEAATLFSLLAAVLGAWVFVHVASEVREGDTQAFDVWAVRSLRQPGNLAQPIGPAWLPEAARNVTALGGVCVLTIISGIVTGFLCLRRKFGAAGFLVASLAGAGLVNAGFKAFFARPRPAVVPHLTTFDSASFPSGHSLLSAAAYLTLGVVLARMAEGRAAKVYFVSVAMALSVAVGLSRVYLGVHYPTDVLAGWAAGITWAIGCSLAARSLQKWRVVERPAS